MGLKACIFDFDGVIVDSEPLHEQAARQALDRCGVTYPDEIFARFVGRSEQAFFQGVYEQVGPCPVDELIAYKHQAYAVLSEHVRLIPGVDWFVPAARRSFGTLGVATSAIRRDVERTIGRFQMQGWFDAIVSVEDTELHKPHPEPYLKVLELLGVAPLRALVIEDSPSGIKAARAAGCVSAGLTTSFPATMLRAAGADLVAGSFAELAQVLGM